MNMKIISLFLILTSLLGLKSEESDNFCNQLVKENFDSCKVIINKYLEERELNRPTNTGIVKKMQIVDSLISALSKFNCIDSCFYTNGVIMESMPEQVDVSIYRINSNDILKYNLRLELSHPIKVVKFEKR
jgi:hypothetical protein